MATTAVRVWIRRTQRCIRSGCGAYGCDPHHVRGVRMGGTADPEEADRENVVALCRNCHREGHAMGWGTWQGRYGLDLEAEAVETWKRWESEPADARAYWWECATG